MNCLLCYKKVTTIFDSMCSRCWEKTWPEGDVIVASVRDDLHKQETYRVLMLETKHCIFIRDEE